MQRCHKLTVGTERYLIEEFVVIGAFLQIYSIPSCRHQQCSLRWVSLNLPIPVFTVQRRAVAERSREQNGLQAVISLNLFITEKYLSARLIAVPFKAKLFTTGVCLHNRHQVFGNGTGFVGTDIIAASQRLNGNQLSDNGISPRHALQSDRHGNRNHYRQPFGNNRYGGTDAEKYHLNKVPSHRNTNHHHECRQRQSDRADDFGEELETTLQRRCFFLGSLHLL